MKSQSTDKCLWTHLQKKKKKSSSLKQSVKEMLRRVKFLQPEQTALAYITI